MTLDQVEVFLAVVAAGSFSEAARGLGRAQSAITYAVQKLEDEARVELFDRSAYRPVLTAAGRALLPRARRVADEAGAFRERWPAVSLRIMVENLGAAAERVLSGGTAMGIITSVVDERPDLERRRVGEVCMVPVAAPAHPLAKLKGTIPREMLQDHVQLVITDRSQLSAGREFGVLSAQTWRLSDLGAKHAMLVSGLGWGAMPLDMVREDLAAGRLVEIAPEGLEGRHALPLFLAWRTDRPLGPATRWLADRLLAGEDLAAHLAVARAAAA